MSFSLNLLSLFLDIQLVVKNKLSKFTKKKYIINVNYLNIEQTLTKNFVVLNSKISKTKINIKRKKF